MTFLPQIRILESESKKIGDLFTQLIGSLFEALGYSQIRFNIQKTGREIDIEAAHRTEQRIAIAECKATRAKIGGDDVNKFAGSLEAERRRNRGLSVEGYFVSLSGFRETAIQQEKDIQNRRAARDLGVAPRMVLLNGSDVVQHLISGRILLSLEEALMLAAACASDINGLTAEKDCHLLVHELGCIWSIYFSVDRVRTHFCLIHADGEVLPEDLAQQVIQSDRAIGGQLHSLIYLSPMACRINAANNDLFVAAKRSYLSYLISDCGLIELQGMPPLDSESRFQNVHLEDLFVPVHLTRVTSNSKLGSKRELAGEIVASYPRLIVLGAPGSGKSTLLKRIAVAYAAPAKRQLVDDRLPENTWFPILIRCRQLRSSAHLPILHLISQSIRRAELSEELCVAFDTNLKHLVKGQEVLLLIDGLDEIQEAGDRIAFAQQLRVFLRTYPTVRAIVTSREPGFRVASVTLSSLCESYRVAEFDSQDIAQLCLSWHRRTSKSPRAAEREASNLTAVIESSDRLRQIARSPVLLMTLLLIRRWLGQLPSRRVVLYQKAVEVLLMTWNREGHEALEPEEVLPQLAFVAYSMTTEGSQRITEKNLRSTLKLARQEMPEILAFTKQSIRALIELIESRSSILVLVGHELDDGELQPIYEFRHLTFQEYLTAYAIVEGFYSGRQEDKDLLLLLRPYLADVKWREIIPLVVVLAGKDADAVFRLLLDICQSAPNTNERDRGASSDKTGTATAHLLLVSQCLLDEAKLSPPLIEEGLFLIATNFQETKNFIGPIAQGKFSEVFFDVAASGYEKFDAAVENLGNTLGLMVVSRLTNSSSELTDQVRNNLIVLLESPSLGKKAAAAFAVQEIADGCSSSHGLGLPRRLGTLLKSLGDAIVPLLFAEQASLWLAACAALASLGRVRASRPEAAPNIIPRLLELWRFAKTAEVRLAAARALVWLPIIDRKLLSISCDSELENFIFSKSRVVEFAAPRGTEKRAAFVISYYAGEPYQDRHLSWAVPMEFKERDGGYELRNDKFMKRVYEEFVERIGMIHGHTVSSSLVIEETLDIKTKMLIVDSDVERGASIFATFRAHGLPVVLAETAEDALLLNEREQPDIVALSLGSDLLRTGNLARQLRKQDTEGIAWIIAIDDGVHILSHAGLEATFDGYFEYPHDVEWLLRVVQKGDKSLLKQLSRA